MRKTLLLVCLVTAACAKHGGESIAITKNSPQAPINQPDTAVAPPANSGEAGSPGAQNGNEGSGSGGAGSGGSGSSSDPTQGSGSGATVGPVGPGTGGPGGGGPSGGPSQPVPEPGTLLLVGTGLAGIALLRRRREPRAE